MITVYQAQIYRNFNLKSKSYGSSSLRNDLQKSLILIGINFLGKSKVSSGKCLPFRIRSQQIG